MLSPERKAKLNPLRANPNKVEVEPCFALRCRAKPGVLILNVQLCSRVCWGTRDDQRLTAIFRAVPEGYIAFVEKLPGANTQGEMLDEARDNLREAVALVLEATREVVEKTFAGQPFTKESFELPR
jgi:predicted RNase H-like HicB family nuclease